jgi:hypothetical protein
MSRHVYIEFTRPHKDYKRFPILSWLIRLIEWTPYSHVRLTWINTTGRKVVYEASGASVKFIGTLSQEKKKVKILDSYEIDITREEYRKLIDLCMKYADISYGLLQLLGIGLSYLPWFDKNIFSDGRRSQVCSELVGEILESVKNIDIKEDLDIAGPKMINKTLVSYLDRPDIRKGFLNNDTL